MVAGAALLVGAWTPPPARLRWCCSATSTCSNPHQPAHRGQFAPFEYAFYTGLTGRYSLVDLFWHLHPGRVEHSWARRPDLGYRYDHAHGSRALAEQLTSCEYVHETRETGPDGSRFTDHSGLAVRLALTASTALLTSDPATAATHAEPEPTLF
ncbi:MAG: hypothetical protein ACRDUV_08160 [Pseudonocardiaceae bacterium]